MDQAVDWMSQLIPLLVFRSFSSTHVPSSHSSETAVWVTIYILPDEVTFSEWIQRCWSVLWDSRDVVHRLGRTLPERHQRVLGGWPPHHLLGQLRFSLVGSELDSLHCRWWFSGEQLTHPHYLAHPNHPDKIWERERERERSYTNYIHWNTMGNKGVASKTLWHVYRIFYKCVVL